MADLQRVAGYRLTSDTLESGSRLASDRLESGRFFLFFLFSLFSLRLAYITTWQVAAGGGRWWRGPLSCAVVWCGVVVSRAFSPGGATRAQTPGGADHRRTSYIRGTHV